MTFDEALRRYHDGENIEMLAAAIVSEMSIKEKLYMVGGHHNRLRDIVKHGRAYNAEPIHASGCKRLGVPDIRFADGPRGIVCANNTCFPVTVARGASFDTELERKIGRAIGEEAVLENANFFGGVCINLLRHPAWGRAQESYGEDTVLLGKMGAALTEGVQENGVIACVKHFALNSIENLRFKVDVTADERTLREVYLPHFKSSIDAGAGSVMGAYNKFRGSHCCENRELLTKILRNEWGFEGFTISDFTFGVREGKKAIKSGLDIEMPNTNHYGRELREYVKSDESALVYVEKSAVNIIKTLLRFTSVYNQKRQTLKSEIRSEHANLAREAAEASMVLLKNNDILPLDINKIKTVAVAGRFANTANIGDKGSSSVFPKYTVTPFEGIKNYCGDNAEVICAAGDKEALLAAKRADVVIVAVGLDYNDEGEFTPNFDYQTGITLSGDRKSLRIRREDAKLIKKLSKINKNIVVTLTCGSALLIDEWEKYAGAVMLQWYPGMEGGNALAGLLFGQCSPSGKLPFTVAQCESDYPRFLYREDGRLQINYGYYHGYTLLDKKGKNAAYPFGFGLSYTEFSHSDLNCRLENDKIIVNFKLKNIGNCCGSEVSQVYFGSKNSVFERPVKQLKAFTKTSLQPGEQREITLEIPVCELSFYNPETKKYTPDRVYSAYLSGDGKSFLSTDIKL